jgi:hypothetical protein
MGLCVTCCPDGSAPQAVLDKLASEESMIKGSNPITEALAQDTKRAPPLLTAESPAFEVHISSSSSELDAAAMQGMIKTDDENGDDEEDIS